MTTARAVANFFLEKSWAEKIPVDQLKLQKLVYYAYAWYAAHKEDKELFPEDIYAWQHGPVIQDLYAEFKNFGRLPITKPATRVDWATGTTEIPKLNDDEEFEKKLLATVWDKYKYLSGVQLSNMTHAENEPWTIMRKTRGIDDHPRIPDELIRETFKPRLTA